MTGNDKNRTTLVTDASAGPERMGSGELQLITMRGNHMGEIFALDLKRPLVIIGREETADVQVIDAEVSRRHAAIRYDATDDRIIVVDLNSSNGTFVNGHRVEGEVTADLGDKIGLGKTTIMRLSHSSEPEAAYANRMYQAVLRDGLTGAFNRRYFDDRLQTEFAFAERHHEPLALLLLDLDHFKAINDTFGHVAGDTVLARFVALLHEEVRTEDVVARYGGEEFAVLCRDTTVAQGLVLAERLREAVHAFAFTHDAHTLPVTVSIGVANIAGGAATTAQALVAAADKALYGAKAGGRNRCASAPGATS